MQHLKLK